MKAMTPRSPISPISPAERGSGAGALRREFDSAFARPAGTVDTGEVDLLALRVAGEPYALRLAAIAGLSTDRRIAPLPGVPGLLGLAGVRGSVVAVYALRSFLALPAGAPPRWIALLRRDRTVGLAFDELAGTLRLAPGDLARAAGPGAGRHVREAALAGGVLHPILDVESILATIKTLARAPGARGESER
jgi:chemotaxis signal transduction protein